MMDGKRDLGSVDVERSEWAGSGGGGRKSEPLEMRR